MTLMERFVDTYIVEPGGCWIWTGVTDHTGYARMNNAGRTGYAHRIGYELFVGSIPDGLQLDHLCRVRNCVNWRHLEPVTRTENIRRSPITNSAKTHCKNGHEFTPANTLRVGMRKVRLCRVCRCATVRSSALRRGLTKASRGPRRRTKEIGGATI